MRAFATYAGAGEFLNHSPTNWNPKWIYDVKDKMFVECALDGDVPYVVSNDYSLKRFIQWNLSQGHHEAVATVEERGIHFLSPEEFADHLLQDRL